MPRKNLVKTLIKEREMTLTEFQLKGGFSWSMAQRLAKQDYIPNGTTIKTLETLADIFEVTITDLYENIDE
jgi:hypothetical protein